MKYSIIAAVLANTALAQVTRGDNGLTTSSTSIESDSQSSSQTSPPSGQSTAAQWPAYSAQSSSSTPGYVYIVDTSTSVQASWSATQAPNPHFTGPVPTTITKPLYGTAAQQTSSMAVSSTTKAVSSTTKTSSAQQATFTGGANGREVYLGMGALMAGMVAVL